MSARILSELDLRVLITDMAVGERERREGRRIVASHEALREHAHDGWTYAESRKVELDALRARVAELESGELLTKMIDRGLHFESEVARLREVLAAARAVADVYDGSEAGRALWDAIAAYDASKGGDDAG